MKRRRKTKGGTLKGTGTYGKVFGNPRPPCVGESADDIPRGEVGKLFKSAENHSGRMVDLHYHDIEWSVLDKLQSKLDAADFARLQNYCVLPLKQCNVDYKHMIDREDIYNPTWFANKNGEFDAEYNSDARKWDKMITYPEGEMSMLEKLEKFPANTPKSWVALSRKLENIMLGVQLLHRNGFVHLDIKSQNVIYINNTFKIIDMGDVTHVRTDSDFYPKYYGSFMYYIYPTYSVIMGLVEDKYPIDHIGTGVVQHGLNDSDKRGRPIDDTLFNVNSLKHVIPNFVYSAFSINALMGFTTEQTAEIYRIRSQIMADRYLHFAHDIGAMPNLGAWRNAVATNSPAVLNYMQPIYRDIKSKPLSVAKLEMAKRVDCYAIGVLLLETLHSYLHIRGSFTPELREMFVKFYQLAEKCCVYKRQPFDINDIYAEYMSIYTSPSPVPQPSPQTLPQPPPQSAFFISPGDSPTFRFPPVNI